jgi:NAD(P) transhydrogenase subunit alpha
MKVGTPKELASGENRVAMTPESAGYLQKLGYECLIQSGAGEAAGFSDEAYKNAGVTVVKTAAALWKDADIVAKVRQPDQGRAEAFPKRT